MNGIYGQIIRERNIKKYEITSSEYRVLGNIRAIETQQFDIARIGYLANVQNTYLVSAVLVKLNEQGLLEEIPNKEITEEKSQFYKMKRSAIGKLDKILDEKFEEMRDCVAKIPSLFTPLVPSLFFALESTLSALAIASTASECTRLFNEACSDVTTLSDQIEKMECNRADQKTVQKFRSANETVIKNLQTLGELVKSEKLSDINNARAQFLLKSCQEALAEVLGKERVA